MPSAAGHNDISSANNSINEYNSNSNVLSNRKNSKHKYIDYNISNSNNLSNKNSNRNNNLS